MRTLNTTLLFLAINLLFKASIPAEIDSKKLDKMLKKSAGLEDVNLVLIPDEKSTLHNGSFYKVFPDDSSSLAGYLYSGRVQCCRAGGCGSDVNPTDESLDNEYFDYFIFYDKQLQVKSIKITSYQATYGHEITAPSWLKQFIGFAGKKELQPGKDIDAISGATISVYAITADIEHKTKVLSALASN